MKDVEIIKSIRNFAVNHSDDDDIHGFAHVQRVYDLCDKIGIELRANMLILRISTLLHDIGRNSESSNTVNKNHAILSAEISKDYLKSQLFGLSEEELNQIIHCILAHSFSNKIKPLTLEAKILSDVDKLDALGAIGLFRTIGFTIRNTGGIKELINHLETKILNLKNYLYLDYTKEIAEERLQIIKKFYNKIKNQTKL
ncbi:MAG: HD domain-containing protein [Promethearchaeota archaeon]